MINRRLAFIVLLLVGACASKHAPNETQLTPDHTSLVPILYCGTENNLYNFGKAWQITSGQRQTCSHCQEICNGVGPEPPKCHSQSDQNCDPQAYELWEQRKRDCQSCLSMPPSPLDGSCIPSVVEEQCSPCEDTISATKICQYTNPFPSLFPNQTIELEFPCNHPAESAISCSACRPKNQLASRLGTTQCSCPNSELSWKAFCKVPQAKNRQF